ncbi:MAG: hypothetical protein NZ521_10530, partial [Flammeovirgaceae bacterium]|nr:hypothetical protein [Flammeovirgaceae bacterium]MDW8288654.1 hypothetical protein [Flammeovirgaceae bacterium]
RTKTTMQIAYEAAFEAFMAKKAWNPYDKLAHVDMSKRIFKQIVEKDPENIEYRFLRLSMNHHLPSFLQETRWLEEDKAKLYHHFTQPDLDGSLEWNAYILRFLLDKKLFTPLQEEKLKIIYESMIK